MELERIMLSESKPDSESQGFYVFSYMWRLKAINEKKKKRWVSDLIKIKGRPVE